MLAERVKDWSRAWKQEAREEGRQEGESTLVLRLLELRFGPLAEADRVKVRLADADTLLVWGERILTAPKLADVFEESEGKATPQPPHE